MDPPSQIVENFAITPKICRALRRYVRLWPRGVYHSSVNGCQISSRIYPMKATHTEVRKHLERVLATRGFQRAPRLGLFLRFIVEETLAGRRAQLKEYT